MNRIEIKKMDLVRLDADAIVNAANEDLRAGGGVCGAIFWAAGHDELQDACDRIGHCDTGSAVITPGFKLPATYVIHAVGPVWTGGRRGEDQLLYNAYHQSLALAQEHGCHSIGFPLISSGIYGYPKDLAWQQAIRACRDFLHENPAADLTVTFCVLDDAALALGQRTVQELGGDAEA